MFSFGPELWEVFPLFGIFLPIYGGRGVSPQFPKSLLSKISPKIAHLNKLKVSHKVSPIFLERGVPNRVGFVIVLVRPLLSKVWIYPGVFSLMYLIWAILFLTFHRGLLHGNKMYKSQYCILNKSLSCNFGAVRVIWWREEGFWGALCSKYLPCSDLDINSGLGLENGIRDACSTADIFNACGSGLVVVF